METVVFTNGCFDLIHPGHIDLLKKARAFGTKLIVGLNSDESVRAIKGSPRPFQDQTSRAAILKELRCVDEVLIFGENTPERLIKEIKPDVLVKGGDWSPEQIVGAGFVLKNGGQVFSIPFQKDVSSSKLIEKIKSADASEITETESGNQQSFAANFLRSHITVCENLRRSNIPNIERCAQIIFETIKGHKNISFCAERESSFVFEQFTEQLKTISEDQKTSSLVLPLLCANNTAENQATNVDDVNSVILISNQIETMMCEGDLLISFDLSGNSDRIMKTIMQARQINCRTIGITGVAGKKLVSLCDAGVLIPSAKKTEVLAAALVISDCWNRMIIEESKRFDI